MAIRPANSLTQTALGWVRDDLDKLLQQLRQQVENLANNPMAGASAVAGTDATIEQLMLTFETLNLDGAKQVMAEMHKVCGQINGQQPEGPRVDYGPFGIKRPSRREIAVASLMDAQVVLPAYLDRLQTGHHDLPVLLLPLINKLREAAGEEALTEGTVFAPLLDVELPELEFIQRPGYDEPFDYFSNRMQRQYEGALNNWLQDQRDVSLLSPLQGFCETMRHRVKRYPLKRLWWVASEVVGGLMEGYADNSVELRRLLPRLNLLLKTISEAGEEAVDEESVTSITQALLYHVAGARKGCAGLDLVRERFELQRLMPDREELMRARGTLSGRDRDMYRSLSAAVQDELALVKDALDLELRTGKVNRDARLQSSEALGRLVDTLRLLGLSTLATPIAEALPAFERGADADRAQREANLTTLAERLLMVESALAEQIETLGEPVAVETGASFIELSAFEQNRIRSRLLEEAVLSVHFSQEAVRKQLGGDTEADPSEPLHQVAGALRMIDDDVTAQLTVELLAYVERFIALCHSDTVAEELTETLADSLAALELYLAAQRDKQAEGARFSDILADRLEALATDLGRGEAEAAARVAVSPRGAAAIKVVPPPPAPPGAALKEAGEAPAGEPAVAPTEERHEAAATDELPAPIDPELREIFLEEYESVLESLQLAIPAWMGRLDDVKALTEIRRAFHTLKGSGRMVGAEELGDFSWQVEDMLNALLEGRVDRFGDISVMVRLAQASLPSLRQRLLQESSGLKRAVIELVGARAQALGRGEPCDWEELRGLLPAYLAGMLPGGIEAEDTEEEPPGGEDELQSILRQELSDNLDVVQNLLEAMSKERATRADDTQLRAIHTIAGALAMQPQGRDAEIAKALENVWRNQSRTGRAFSSDAMWTMVSAVGRIQDRLDRLRGHLSSEPDDSPDELIAHLELLADELGVSVPMPELEGGLLEIDLEIPEGEAPERPAFDPDRSVFARDQAKELPAQEDFAAGLAEAERELEAATAQLDEAPAESQDALELDSEIVQIFLEEAREVLERSDGLLDQWRDELTELRWVRNLQREIHTLKGGARMAGLASMGEYTHAIESLLERIADRHMPPSVSAVQVLEDACDRLQGWVERLAGGEIPDTSSALELLGQQLEALDSVAVAPEAAQGLREVKRMPEEPAAPAEPDEERGAPGQIRVAADLLDSLINASGEVSIFRSRLEQQVGGLRENLTEFDETVARLREQFRKLDIEIEAQVRSSYPDLARQGSNGFDPLELDEFSTLHQLSRGLSESVADLLNLQEMLEENTRRAEKLLIQQSRVSTELQEGLMKTRMVPFGSIAPRLRRLVRSAAKETGKQARLQLQVVGSSDELDRNVLETITAPLEHMMRNAVAHGIESPATRRKLGKQAQGEIIITVEAEATEFVIRIEDDGAGIDTEAIRERAIERGLLDPGAEVRRAQLYDFMLASGFSTSSEVTRLAGRGVGMDVVNNEIKHIGGSLEIDSEPGKGSRFTIRIPFTLAVMQAIGLVAGEHRYLLPLSSVVGVARTLPADYRELVSQENPAYRFAGQDYPVLDIEPLLGEPSRPLGRDNVSLLIVAAGEQRAALRVPALLPHREVVIKPVGPQIGSVPGILGGSISANGDVVVILDPGPLIRHALIHGARPAVSPEAAEARASRPLIMVVDDSITMRKVTSRVLESHDFEVITARDGVDATEQLQDRTPDLMLLDIEMPRMDGYELTEHVRDDARLRNVPIMMITSRAGQKHRDRAAMAGANAYLTKPYSESELIREVKRLLEEESS